MSQNSHTPNLAIGKLIKILENEIPHDSIEKALKQWAKNNGLKLLFNFNGFLLISTPSIRGTAPAFSSLPTTKKTILLLCETPPNILDLMGLMGSTHRFLVPIHPIEKLKLRSLLKVIVSKGSNDPLGVFFDSHRILFTEAKQNKLEQIHETPFQFLIDQSRQTCGLSLWNLMKTPSLFEILQQGLPDSNTITWSQLLASLPPKGRQSIGVLLTREGYLGAVENLQLFELNSSPENAQILLLCEGYMENYMSKKDLSHYRNKLNKVRLPFGQKQFFDSLTGLTGVNPDLVALAAVVHSVIIFRDSNNIQLATIVSDWINHVCNLNTSKSAQQHLLISYLLYLNHYGINPPQELTERISWEHFKFDKLNWPTRNYCVEFLESHLKQFKAIFKHPQNSKRDVLSTHQIRLKMIQISTKSGLEEPKQHLVGNLISADNPQTPLNYLSTGRTLIRAREYSLAVKYYQSIPNSLINDNILLDFLTSHYCSYQFEEIRSLLADPKTTKLNANNRIVLQTKILTMEGRFEDAIRQATVYIDQLDSKSESFDIALELAKINSAMARFDLASKQLDLLAMAGKNRPTYEMIGFEKQLQRWCSETTSKSIACGTPKENLNLKNLLPLALKSSDPDKLSQDCFSNYISWILPYHSYQHWFLLCAIAVSLRADRLDLTKKYLNFWKADPWIVGKQQIESIQHSYECENYNEIVFWERLIITCFPKAPSNKPWAKLLLKMTQIPE